MGDRISCLVVDDDEGVRAVVLHTLDGEEFALLEAADGEAGWEVARRHRPEIVVSDIRMPGLDGLGLLRRIRSDPELAGTYVCLLTALGERERLLEGLAAGADDYLVKPFDPEELRLRIRNAARLVRLQRETERLAARLHEFYSVAAHEIRTPMAAILSSAKVLLRYGRDDPARVKRFAQIIVEEGERLRRLIDGLLDLHRLEAGGVVLEREPVELLGLARHIAHRFRDLAGEEGIEVVVEGTPLTVHADRDRLEQVLYNLLANAVRHTPPGTRVTVRVVPVPGGARLEVDDQGPGVPEAIRDRLFQRFVSDARGVAGTGLGLAICRAAVEAHGGRIGYLPRPAGGARFWLELPGGSGED